MANAFSIFAIPRTHWTDEWIGLKFALRGRGPQYDCLGLFLALHRERFDRELFDPMCSTDEAFRHYTQYAERGRFSRVPSATEGDALLFVVPGLGIHVGYALNEWEMLHIELESAGSVRERWNTPRWLSRLKGIYRYVG